MAKKFNQVATAALAAVAGSLAGAGIAAADSGAIETRLPDVSEISLTELASTENSVLVNSIKQVRQEADTPYGPLGGFASAPPAH